MDPHFGSMSPTLLGIRWKKQPVYLLLLVLCRVILHSLFADIKEVRGVGLQVSRLESADCRNQGCGLNHNHFVNLFIFLVTDIMILMVSLKFFKMVFSFLHILWHSYFVLSNVL